MGGTMRLTIELVPSPLWGLNLHRLLPRHVWVKIQRKASADSGDQCGICGASTPLECHERWAYDDDNHVQKLMGFVALCEMCHCVKHIGRTGQRAAKGELDYEEVVSHFMQVNKCNRKTFEIYKAESMELHAERSLQDWRIDFGDYKYLVPLFKPVPGGIERFLVDQGRDT